jgi:hypothetical protein
MNMLHPSLTLKFVAWTALIHAKASARLFVQRNRISHLLARGAMLAAQQTIWDIGFVGLRDPAFFVSDCC